MTAALIAQAGGRARLAAFLAELARQVDSAPDEQTLLAAMAPALQALVSHDDWLDDAFAQPHPERFQQYLLYCDPRRRFSVVSFVWGPGQETPVHDHTTWGLVGLLRGGELSERYEIRDGRPVSTGEDRLEPGDVTAVSPSVGDIHRVRNAYADRVSISIHAYGGDIGAIERHIYPSDGGVKDFVSGYSNAVLPNVWGQG